MTIERFLRFKNCFDAFYLSQEIHLRKPNSDIYNFVLDTHQINPKEILFIDDGLNNVRSARDMGINSIRYMGLDNLVEEIQKFGIKIN